MSSSTRSQPRLTPGLLALGILVVRVVLLVALGPEPVREGGSLGWLVLPLDAAALSVYAAALVGGAILGDQFGSVLMALLLVAAPAIGFGFTIEALLGGPASDRFGLASLAAGAVGMCAAAGGRADRFARVLVTVLGVLGITLATKVAVEDGALARWVIPAPFVAAALVALVLRPLRPSPEAITSQRDANDERR